MHTAPLTRPQRPLAVAYTRVSTEEQKKHGGSLPMQEARIRAYCELVELDLVAVIAEEGVSAAKPLSDRPGGSQLLATMAREKALHVVALKLDRLFRDAADALTRIRTWDSSGISLHLVDMGGAAMNTASAMGRMMLTILAGFAEWERNIIAERTAAVLAHKKETRQVYARTPLGYQREGDQLVADPRELETVGRILQLHEKGWSMRAIAERLNAEEIPTKRGGRWHASTIRYVLGNGLYSAVKEVAGPGRPSLHP